MQNIDPLAIVTLVALAFGVVGVVAVEISSRRYDRELNRRKG